jgi:hypothetical protein
VKHKPDVASREAVRRMAAGSDRRSRVDRRLNAEEVERQEKVRLNQERYQTGNAWKTPVDSKRG